MIISKNEKINFIYEKVADKTLKIWCKIETIYQHNPKSKSKTYLYCYDKGCSLAVITPEWKQCEVVETHSIIDLEPYKPNYYLNPKDFIEDWYDTFNDWTKKYNNRKYYRNIKIIWLPVTLSHILDWWDKNVNLWNQEYESILKRWFDKLNPIEEQEDDFIDFIYNLILKYSNE